MSIVAKFASTLTSGRNARMSGTEGRTSAKRSAPRPQNATAELLEVRRLYATSTLYVKRDPTNPLVADLWNNTSHQGTGTPTQTASIASGAPGIAINGQIDGTAVTIDYTGGTTLNSNGFLFQGNSAYTASNSILLIGTAGNDTTTVTSSKVTFNSTPINYTYVGNLYYNPFGGTENLTVSSGRLVLPSGGSGGGIVQRTFSNLNISANALLYVAPPPTHGDRQLLIAPNAYFIINGKLDMTSNDAIVRNGNLAGVTGNVRNGINLTTSATGVVTNKGTAPTNIAVVSPTDIRSSTFDGVALGNDVIVEWTFDGQLNFDGIVDGSDYALMDNAFNQRSGGTGGSSVPATGWEDGDYNYDGVTDQTDYNLIDAADTNEGSTML